MYVMYVHHMYGLYVYVYIYVYTYVCIRICMQGYEDLRSSPNTVPIFKAVSVRGYYNSFRPLW